MGRALHNVAITKEFYIGKYEVTRNSGMMS